MHEPHARGGAFRRFGAPAGCLLAAALGLPGCRAPEPELEPLSPDEIETLAALRRADPERGRIEDRGTLFLSLDQNLRTWRTLGAKNEGGEIEERDSLEIALTRQVYLNFDTILAELERGADPEHRVIAAAALGFSRIPAPDEPGGDPQFPAVHATAVRPLLDVIDSGSDDLVVNALLSLGRIADPDTPRQVLVEVLVKHHHDDARANAALAIGRIAGPQDAPLLLAPLIGALADRSAKVRLHAVKALGALEDRSVQGPLLERLRRDDSPLVQAAAALQLGRVGDLHAVQTLIEGLMSQTTLVHHQCQRSLVALTGRTDLKNYKAWREWWSGSELNPQRSGRG